MAFTPKDWKDSPETTTPISAAALEDMETRLAAYADGGASGTLARYATAGIFTAQQTFKLDVVDPGANIVLDNLTAIATHGGPPYKKSAITWFRDGARKWIAGLDVGNGTYGSGSDIRDDFYLLHHWAPDTTKSADILYLTDEVYPRVGVTQNTPVGQLHVSAQTNARPVAVLNHAEAGANNYLLRLDYLDAAKGGIWLDSGDSTAPVRLSLGASGKPAAIVSAVAPTAGGDRLYQGYRSGDSQARFVVNDDASIALGSGSASTDVRLSRSAAGALTIDSLNAATATLVVVKGNASQGSANLFEVRTSASTLLFAVLSDGRVTFAKDVWHKDTSNAERFHFANAGATYLKSAVGNTASGAHVFRNSADTDIATILGNGKLLATGGIGVGNSAAATTPGSVVKKMQVFDASGTSLGYVPIYDAIT